MPTSIRMDRDVPMAARDGCILRVGIFLPDDGVYNPHFDRNMNTGNPTGADARGVAALQTISPEPGFASFVDLPVITS